MNVTFEARRLYVAPRKSVLFFAKVGDHRVRCYVEQDALIETARALREETDIYQRCLLVFDQHKDLIQAEWATRTATDFAKRFRPVVGDDGVFGPYT